MDTKKIVVRPAGREDAALIAEVVCMAVGYDTTHPIYHVFLTLAASDKAQYSYRNVLIAEVDGTVAGAIVGYDGALLYELREPIFPLLEKYLGSVPDIEDETAAGEFYLDSLGVLPQFRGMGVGAMLLNAMSNKAFAEGRSYCRLRQPASRATLHRVRLCARRTKALPRPRYVALAEVW